MIEKAEKSKFTTEWLSKSTVFSMMINFSLDQSAPSSSSLKPKYSTSHWITVNPQTYTCLYLNQFYFLKQALYLHDFWIMEHVYGRFRLFRYNLLRNWIKLIFILKIWLKSWPFVSHCRFEQKWACMNQFDPCNDIEEERVKMRKMENLRAIYV